MKFFLDTANLEEIRELASWGIVDGVTTNPSLCSKENLKFDDLVREICRIVPGPVSVECLSISAPDIVVEARGLAAAAPNVVIKIPVSIEGLKATKALAAEGIKVNISSTQALLAAKAGARYVSPFIGRLDDISQDGMELIEEIVAIFENYRFETEVIVASIRHPRHVVEAALLGADIATIPASILRKMVAHPLTASGMETFLKDWAKVRK
jgi:transaldolase